MTLIDSYKADKKQSWIRRQLAQGMIVYFWANEKLTVIKSVIQTKEGLIALNKNHKTKLENQPLYSTKADIMNPIDKFEDKPLAIPEYVDLICKCF